MYFPLILKLLCITLIITANSAATAKSVIIDTEHRGIRLVGISLPSADRYDVDLLPLKPAMEKLKGALNKIYKSSSFSSNRIDTLKKNGRVTLVYDADFPKDQFSSVIIAAFFPDFFQKANGGLKEFLVVIGRFGIKWPIDKLAAIIVHELVGHGLQHLRGRTNQDRKIDKECEALIYEEKVYQDFKMQRDTRSMVLFRRSMLEKWCSDFRLFLTRKGVNADEIWNYGKPDVSYLLTHFDAYIKHLRKSGISGKAVAAAKAKRKVKFTEYEKRVRVNGSSDEMLSIGNRHLKGIGVKRDPVKALSWFKRSAELGNADAQYTLGVLYNTGLGAPQNLRQAYKWLSLASIQGHKKANAIRGKLKSHLSTKQIFIVNEWIAKWQPKRID